MTVLPDAPIDPATGLPVPTIAVATDGGTSVIQDSGVVFDITRTGGHSAVSIHDTDKVVVTRKSGGTDVFVIRLPLSADTSDDGADILKIAPSGEIVSLSSTPISETAYKALGSSLGVSQFAPNYANKSTSMIAYTTSTYNTGWMNGDIKGAFLSDTDDTDLVAAELVTNGTFDTDTDWNKGGGWSIAGGVATKAAGSASNINQQPLAFVPGTSYRVSFTVSNRTAGGVFHQFAGGTNVFGPSFSSNGTFTVYRTAASGNTEFRITNDALFDGSIDNVSVQPAGADRSVNNNGLNVNGTVTRSPVATGADLVAYSGFSASNYLEQPVNTGLDFGTGDFAIMGWLKQAANTAVETILERDSAVSAQRFTLAVNASGFLTFTCDDDTTARTATSNRVVDNDVWTHFVALYDGAGDVKIYLNGALDDTETGSALLTLNNASAVLRVGLAVDDAEPLDNADLALLRISATVPSDSQIKRIYEDEKFLFQDNAQATLYGASDAVTALAHDSELGLLHVGTSAGRSVFQGLRRVSNTTTAVGTAISASNGLVVEE
jgi:hypothetical protein